MPLQKKIKERKKQVKHSLEIEGFCSFGIWDNFKKWSIEEK